ncbi:serine/threonine-protein kinase [Polyangium sp. 15x6]|uniref:serine/threonine-protein kinase n=1 Tax=Polyangium sp. 15x6 TaxID=3042687 RepID=UPI00249C343E|nr:serine/threonine-protein kinase [Polyangium sp. 15x6]MDI3290996.1 serine/threonine-protein kinase [Polyangium sp. 15x6]
MLAPGSRIEDYEVVRLVAVGAMCHVYEANTMPLGHPVALKVLHGMWCSDKNIVARFVNEASILQTIRHSHIVTLLMSGTLPDGSPYMVLEWLPNNLAHALAAARGPLAPNTAAHIASQIASALAALHERGIVHRDLKPANVLLDRESIDDAQVRLADLGLAKVRPEQRGEPIAIGHISTGGSALLGTWDYMAPEQWIKSKTVEPKADVYSLGVLLFQMLAGRLPFVAEQAKDLMALHLFKDPPMDRLQERAPARLRELVGRMLQKTPSTRPGLEEVLGELAEVR